MARRVLPTPPGPVKVSKQFSSSARRRSSRASSSTRSISRVGWSGRWRGGEAMAQDYKKGGADDLVWGAKAIIQGSQHHLDPFPSRLRVRQHHLEWRRVTDPGSAAMRTG